MLEDVRSVTGIWLLNITIWKPAQHWFGWEQNNNTWHIMLCILKALYKTRTPTTPLWGREVLLSLFDQREPIHREIKWLAWKPQWVSSRDGIRIHPPHCFLANVNKPKISVFSISLNTSFRGPKAWHLRNRRKMKIYFPFKG